MGLLKFNFKGFVGFALFDILGKMFYELVQITNMNLPDRKYEISVTASGDWPDKSVLLF